MYVGGERDVSYLQHREHMLGWQTKPLSLRIIVWGDVFVFVFCCFFVAHNKQMILARLLTIPPNTDDSHTNTGSVAEGWVLLECSGTFCTKGWWGKGHWQLFTLAAKESYLYATFSTLSIAVALRTHYPPCFRRSSNATCLLPPSLVRRK